MKSRDKLLNLLDRNLSRKRKVLSGLSFPNIGDKEIVRITVDLSLENAAPILQRDPYWPKWDSPWWKMLLLTEMGLSPAIPRETAELMLKTVNNHYLHHFPLKEEEIPEGKDPYRHIICHCALGSIYSVLSKSGVNPGFEMTWARDWFASYQLPDGGMNCDEAAYTKEKPHSSFLSTLPVFEALVFNTKFGHTADETKFMSGAAWYLLKRRFARSLSRDMALIDPQWLKPVFPRFYFYDILRGLNCVTGWADRLLNELPIEPIAEALFELEKSLDPMGRMISRKSYFSEDKTLVFAEDKWTWDKCSTFSLLDQASDHLNHSPWLTREWYEVLERVSELMKKGAIN